MKEEGVIKFHCNWIESKAVDAEAIAQLNDWREKLYARALIGVTEDGIGYGNISRRWNGQQFIISGSGTGALPQLSSTHYALVTDYDIDQNIVFASGPLPPSSESLTHAAIYAAIKEVQFVFHVHHHGLWKQLLKSHPSTAVGIAYGTPEMAHEVSRLVTTTRSLSGIFAMAGHDDGIVSFGCAAGEAGGLLVGF